MKQYITYKRKKINEFLYEDPNTNNRVYKETWGKTIFTETPYKIPDGRFISIVEYADTETAENIEYFRTLDLAFEFTFIDELTANTLLKELWTDETWIQYVKVNNFIFEDNKPTLNI